MERRAFLALLGSAPLAALAPLPKFLPTPRVVYKTGTAVALAMESIDTSLRFHPKAFEFVWPMPTRPLTVDVLYGHGYVRRGTDASGDLVIDKI